MTSFCDGHAFGCGCTDRCTKTVDLGSFTKRRDDINADAVKAFTTLWVQSCIGWAAIVSTSCAGWALFSYVLTNLGG